MNRNLSSKTERKYFYLIGLLIVALALITGVVMYHHSGSSITLLLSMIIQSNIHSVSIMSTNETQDKTITQEELRAKVDKELEE